MRKILSELNYILYWIFSARQNWRPGTPLLRPAFSALVAKKAINENWFALKLEKLIDKLALKVTGIANYCRTTMFVS